MREIHVEENPLNALSKVAVIARFQREKHARKTAETLIEQKSRELYAANKELESVLGGSVKLLTDVLALTKPDVFQKAAKVQRWARRISEVYAVERPWELDLAAILYPLGIIALSDEVATKYALDMELNAEEQQQINESPLAAYNLVHTIPKMQGVANAIYYGRKGFDGSGYPQDETVGRDIPQAGRVLKVLIDLADAATGVSKSRIDAFNKLIDHKEQYDLEILKVAHTCLILPEKDKTTKDEVLNLEPPFLGAGDIVQRDILDANNRLMLAAGAELTQISIKRLVSLWQEKKFVGEVTVLRTQET